MTLYQLLNHLSDFHEVEVVGVKVKMKFAL